MAAPQANDIDKATRPPASFLTIPPELREHIYTHLLNPSANRIHHQDEYTSYNYLPALVLFKLNRQIYIESRKIFRDLNIFVRIETPWREAQQHVALEGHVPIIVTGKRAAEFQQHSLNIGIDAPQHGGMELDMQRFIILLDDLDKFTSMWYYADLTHPSLNENLRLTLSLHDPFRPGWDEKRLSKGMQRRMLVPFGMVKNLHSTRMQGEVAPYSSLEQEMRKLQAEPHRTPEECLQECTKLKQEGNEQLKKGDYLGALETYNAAWKAIHVVIKGRKRHIHADAFFGRELREEPYVGKNGQSERLLLRVQLVANTCQVFLKTQQWHELRFWGDRTINMLRDAMGADERQVIPPEDEAVLGFPAAAQMGKIYYRTAVAYKELGDLSEARRLLRVARVYLPRDENIAKEIAATALQLG